jgi:REP element-mobilizing transposase RayT
MARPLRIEFAGALYHVMARGNQRRVIFRDDQDYRRFLETLGAACQKTGWRVHAYVLMANHYHLLLETPEANLVSGMKWLQGTYTQRHNTRHQVRGPLPGPLQGCAGGGVRLFWRGQHICPFESGAGGLD